jgi:hypothetical protein
MVQEFLELFCKVVKSKSPKKSSHTVSQKDVSKLSPNRMTTKNSADSRSRNGFEVLLVKESHESSTEKNEPKKTEEMVSPQSGVDIFSSHAVFQPKQPIIHLSYVNPDPEPY